MARTRIIQTGRAVWVLVASRLVGLSRESVIRHHHATKAHGKWKWGDSVPANLLNNSSLLLWQLQASNTSLVLAWCIFLCLVHSQLAFIQSLLNIFLSKLLLSHGLCFFKKSAHSSKQEFLSKLSNMPLKVSTTADPCKRLRIKILLSAKLWNEIDLFLAFIHYQEYIHLF